MLRIALGPLRPQYSTKDGTLNIYLTGLRCARVMHLASETSERGDGPMTALIRSSAVAAQLLLVVATSVAVVVGGLSLGERQRARVPEAQAASAPTSLATHENAALGYRIDLRRSYRPATSSLSSSGDLLGRDVYTLLTEGEERANCMRDGSSTPDRANAAYLHVVVFRNPAGLGATDWARKSPFATPRAAVESARVGVLEAARFVNEGITMAYAIRANDRVYVLTPTMWLSPAQHALDDIAATFAPTPPQAFPAAAVRAQPREAAAELGRQLFTAFAARDAAAVARHMPTCRFGIHTVLEPVERGSEMCCIVNRSVAGFADALHTRFASSDLVVLVDPEPRAKVEGQGANRYERFFLRSEWSEGGQTTRVDLYVDEIQGAWYWTEALHHYPRQDLSRTSCGPYRAPWVSGPGGC